MLRLTAGIKTISVKPSAILRKLGAYRQHNRLYLALGEIGRIERTLFMLEWIEHPEPRMACQAGLRVCSISLKNLYLPAGIGQILAISRVFFLSNTLKSVKNWPAFGMSPTLGTDS